MENVISACVSLAPVTTGNYVANGEFQELASVQTYTVGSKESKKAVIIVYDIFGMSSQILQAADRLAVTLSCIVFVPDFFRGDYMQKEWHADPTEENKKLAADWMKSHLDIETNVKLLHNITSEAKAKYSNAGSWGALGLCWGGKITALASAKDTQFKVAGTAHPGRLAREDAEAITIPYILLASPQEPADIVAQYKEVLGSNGYVETYEKMFHGWMGSRANLEDEQNAAEYERGYKKVGDFFTQYL